MKLNPICTLVAASVCCGSFISPAFAGGHEHHQRSDNFMSSGATGRSPLGEPVFLQHWATKQAPREREIHANITSPLSKPIDVPHTGTATTTASSNQGTHVFFTPPPTIVFTGTTPNTTSVNAAGSIRAIDTPFSSSILTTGLDSKTSQPTPQVPVQLSTIPDLLPSIVPVGTGPQGPPTLTSSTRPITVAPSTTSTAVTSLATGR